LSRKKNPGKALRAFRANRKNIAFRLKSYTAERGFEVDAFFCTVPVDRNLANC
jgi:hypothetical protein